ncbi:hypothetical protein KKF86_09755 [bacterium]|nr:hypothetical protein [bacterium]
MKKANIIFILICLPLSVYCQIIWNEPPDTIWYNNQSRWVEVILPTPQNFTATTVNTNQVILQWNEYWTQEMFDAYLNKFSYVAIPNRFSLYRQNITNGELQLQAIPGAGWDKTQYIDTDVELGKEYLYKIMVQDNNYQFVGGLQHWSPRSLPTTITVGEYLSSLPSPTNFLGHYQPYPPMIVLSWGKVSGASLYTIFKSYYNPETSNWNYLNIPLGNVNEYYDTDIQPLKEYFYSIIALHNNESSNRAPTIAVTAGTLDFNAPNNFSGYYESDSAMIILSWDYVKDANSYIVFKSYVSPITKNWVYLAIPVGNVDSYHDSELLPYVGYVYTIIAVNGNIKSDRTNPLTINSGTLSIEDEEYWEAVEEYGKDRKLGWFGCSAK